MSQKRSVGNQRSVFFLLVVLTGVFVLINTPLVWKWMYPIKYEEHILTAAKRFEIDPHLVLAVIQTESGFQSHLVSKKGAVGLMQLMPDTADWVRTQGGFQTQETVDLAHPYANIDMGTWYLRFLLQKFDGNEVLAIAAYNAGPGSVDSWLAKGRWSGSREHIEDIPYGETRHYVQRVLYYHDRYREIYDAELQ